MVPQLFKLLRKSLPLVAIFFAFMAAVTYLVCTCLSDQNHWLRRLWQLSASAGLIAWVLEMTCRRFEAADAKELRDKVADNERKTGDLWRQSGRWRISPESREFLKNAVVFAKYPEQKFLVYVEFENGDGREFAGELVSALQYCGWLGMIVMPPDPVAFKVPYGVAVWTEDLFTIQARDKVNEIVLALGQAGICTADGSRWNISAQSLPQKTVVFCVGKKPPL